MVPKQAHSTISLPFPSRAEIPNTPPLATYLLSLISIKRSNLCVSADVHNTYDLLRVAEEVGNYICVLKTHADIIDDWSEKTISCLQEISRRKHFLLFEDRKLGDIGSDSPLLPRPIYPIVQRLTFFTIQTRYNPNTHGALSR